MSFDYNVNLSVDFTQERIVNTKIRLIAGCIEEIQDFTYTKITRLQVVQITVVNSYRKKPLKYKIKNKVWLSMKNIKTK